MAYRPNQDSSDYKAGYEEGFADALKPPPNYDKERAVIEAARKLKRKQLDNADGWTAAEYDFVLAIEALDNAELDPCQ